MQNDAFLVQQSLAGEHEAFHRLIILYQADVYALVMSWVKNTEDAKELVQDIFLEAHRDLASLKQPERFYFWLRQIAKHRCQNWQERKRQFVPLSEDMPANTPSADEILILRETLAKVMQVIDELPETEKRILKERYLDDSSYEEMQAKHGLSYKALNMRLLRARQKVRARVEKLLAGIGIFSWHDALNKMLLGGVEAVKINAKVKILTTGIASVLVLGGAGVVIWNSHQSALKTQNLAVSQTMQQTNSSPSKKLSVVKAVEAIAQNVNKPINKQKTINDETGKGSKKAKINESTDQVVKAPESNPRTTDKEPSRKETREEFFQRYMKITRSPEFLAQIKNEAEPIHIEYESICKEADGLIEEEKRLEDALITASEEKIQKLQNELEATRSKYKLTIKRRDETAGRIMDAMEVIALRYFTKEELDIALEEKAKRGMVFVLPDKNENQ